MKSTAVMRNPPITEQGVPVEGTSVLARMLTYAHLVLTHLLACHVWTPDSSSRGFYRPYQIALTLFDIIIEFIRVNGVDLYTFEGIQPNFRVGQLPIFVKSKVVLFMRFEQKYIIDKT